MTLNIHNGDCLEVLKTIPDKSIDLVICDLPYGCLKKQPIILPDAIKQKYNKKTLIYHTSQTWDIEINLDALWCEIKRVIKNEKTPIVFFCNTRFGNKLINSNPEWFRYDLVWNKTTGTNFLRAGICPMPCHEMIYLFSKKMPTYNKILNDVGKCPVSVINVNLTRSKLHHTAKPVPLLETLIKYYSNEGDTVLDPTMGSGSTGVAALNLQRNFVGIEMDTECFKIAENRLQNI